jgi:aerobic carbon-monoxide dehydrogenase small subunit
MRYPITLKVNGETWPLEVEPSDVLLETLRSRVGVKSPKPGCQRGDCGSCTVLLDGRTVRSCLLLAVEADGRDIVTVEGIHEEPLLALQHQLHELSSFQCGYCAPGVILSVVELLQHNPSPTRHEVQEALSGNLCRCTGYEPIIEAVLAAARATEPTAAQEV